MYSDLDKHTKGGYIIEDALDVAETFDTTLNVRRGQIFYARGVGFDFENYLLKLNEITTIFNMESDLYHLQDIDNRLKVLPSETAVWQDEYDGTILHAKTTINAQGLLLFSAESLIKTDLDEDTYLTVQDFLGKPSDVWETVED